MSKRKSKKPQLPIWPSGGINTFISTEHYRKELTFDISNKVANHTREVIVNIKLGPYIHRVILTRR